MDYFPACLTELLKLEGGYVNDPHDPGGVTNLGVTIAVWREWTGGAVTIADMHGLTPAKVAPLYRAHYWNAICGDQLPGALAACVFDFAVNSGVGRAGRYLQNLVGAVVDGHIGPGTLKAVQKFIAAHGQAETVRQYENARRAFYRSLPTFPHFGKGWLNRVDANETAALKMVGA